MKNILLSLIAVILFSSCSKKKSSYEDDIKHFQYQLNIEFADAKKSPLTKEDIKSFKGLKFFEIDEAYKLEATLELTPNSPIFEMRTSDERLPLYRKYGIARFSLYGKKFELSVYQSQELMTNSEYEDLLFLPFNDKTNGNLSYGGGRFLDLKLPSEDSNNTIVIDFNKAYNPYCAYSHKYSCPIPPSENNLSVTIKAGVKAYAEDH